MKRFALTAIIIGLAAPVYAQTGTDTTQNKPGAAAQGDQSQMTSPASPSAGGAASPSQGAESAMPNQPSASSQNQPAASAENQPSTAAPSSTPSSPGQAAASADRFLKSQSQDQWLASNFMGQNVYNSAGQEIGTLNDVLFSNDGSVQAVLVGVGGFLGLGEKNVAVNYDLLKQNGGISGNRIVMPLTKDDLRAAPTFERIDRTKTASNASPSGSAATPGSASSSGGASSSSAGSTASGTGANTRTQ